MLHGTSKTAQEILFFKNYCGLLELGDAVKALYTQRENSNQEANPLIVYVYHSYMNTQKAVKFSVCSYILKVQEKNQLKLGKNPRQVWNVCLSLYLVAALLQLGNEIQLL